MALKVPQASFAKGELDPQLQKRVTLAAYDSALATARNACISRTGSIFSRPGRKYYRATTNNTAVVGYVPPGTNYLTEWGHNYVRITAVDGSGVVDSTTVTVLTSTDLLTAHFESSGNFIYVFVVGVFTVKFDYINATIVTAPFIEPADDQTVTVTPTGTPAGHNVDYAVTKMENGEEVFIKEVPSGGTYKLPNAAGQQNSLDVQVHATLLGHGVTEIRVYRRPENGGSYGFIGSSGYIYATGGNYHSTFLDLGQDADYTISFPNRNHAKPAFATVHPTTGAQSVTWKAKTGCIYQQRLLQGWLSLGVTGDDKEAIIASRAGIQTNFMQDIPLNDACSLRFKSGSSGAANIRRMIDADGLVVFTDRGLFYHTGALNPGNLALVKKGKWRIKEDVPPLASPGGLFFVDETTATIRNLVWSTELSGFNAKEISIFSNHLFKTREIISWGFHEGLDPLLYVAFDDGEFAMFTYEFDQEMRAWTRGDSGACRILQIVPTDTPDKTLYLLEKDGNYWWEISLNRWITGSDLRTWPEAHMGEKIAFMDSVVSVGQTPMNALLAGVDRFVIDPVVDGDWEGPLKLTCGTSGIFTAGANNPGDIGEIHRVFDPGDKTYYDLEVIQRDSNDQVIVQPDRQFNSSLTESFPSSGIVLGSFNMYRTRVQVTGLSHLNGEYPAVIVDGEIVCSPNNDQDDYEAMQVVGGVLNLPTDVRGAIVHVGRAIVADVGSLKIATVEQAPTQHESITVNKAYIDVLQSRGLFIGPKFLDHESVASMQPIEDDAVNYNQEAPVVPNRYEQPKTRTYEVTLPGEWENNGEMCLRQVDPVHFHITAITLDVDVEKRDNRS